MALAVVLALAATAHAASPGASLGTTTPGKAPAPPALTSAKATEIARSSPKLQEWLDDHPAQRTTAGLKTETDIWTVAFIDAKDTTIAQVLIKDDTGAITETRVGPQVAWQMARGYKGAFGRAINDPEIWIALLVVFLIPFIPWRQPLSWRTLDLVALCAFSMSLIWFNRGEIFTSVPLTYPPLAYLTARMTWIGLRGRRAAPAADAEPSPADQARRPSLRSWCPTWLLVSVMLVALGLRLGLNAFDSNVIDVGYAGVIGADQIADGQTPYGTFPSDCRKCDTYGPVTYLAYVPFEQAMPWVGRWNDLPAAHGAAVLFDLLTLAGLLVLGWRLGGQRLAAGFGLAWAAFPFTAYALESNSNDSLVAATLVWGLVLAHRPLGRGVSLGLAALAKFTPAILLFLWSRHPFPRARSPRFGLRAYVGGLALVTAATGWVVLLDGADGLRAFWSRTLGYQFGRTSPFSIWGQYTWLRPVQLALAAAVVVFAVVLAVRPKRMDLRTFAALSGALLLGLQLTLTHWFYLYIPWFVPFAFVALLPDWPAAARAQPEVEEVRAETPPVLAAAAT